MIDNRFKVNNRTEIEILEHKVEVKTFIDTQKKELPYNMFTIEGNNIGYNEEESRRTIIRLKTEKRNLNFDIKEYNEEIDRINSRYGMKNTDKEQILKICRNGIKESKEQLKNLEYIKI